MRAMIITGFGGPEVFQAADLPRPEPGPNELLVRVLATSVNPVDYKIRRSGSWAGVKPPAVIGYDVAGLVEAIGPGVQRFAVGDAVFYTPHIFGRPGTYSEYHVVGEDIVAIKPKNLTFLEAASLPLAGGTSWDAVHRLGQVGLGQTALIHAGAGGCGSLAVQMAKAAGARVIATASAKNTELVRSLGAEVVIDYKSDDFVKLVKHVTDGAGVHFAFDTVGGDTMSRTIQVMRPYGHLVSIVNTTADLNAAYGKNLSLHFLFLERAGHKMEALRTMAERGQLRPVVDTVMPLEAVADAHRKIEAGGMRGKLVLQVSPEAESK